MLQRTELWFVFLAIQSFLPVTALGLEQHQLSEVLDQLLDSHPSARRTTISLKVLDLQTGNVLYDRGGDRLLTPASNLKIYTAACALDTFGPRHGFDSKLVASGPITDATLDGELILVGGGDSMLSNRDLKKMADHVRDEWGMQRITGAVMVDNSRYASPLLGPGWMWDDEPDYYSMSITPLMVDFNVLSVRLAHTPEGFVTAALVPPAYYPPIKLIDKESSRGGYRITRRPFEDQIRVIGRGPLAKPLVERLTMSNPSIWIKAMFVDMLRQRGIRVAGGISNQPHSSRLDPSVKPLVHRGESIAETIKHFNRVSENAVGEMLLHEIAIANGKRQPKWADGAQAITHWLVEVAGLEPSSFRLVDGSGLSRYNLISADSSVRLLAFMRKHKHSQVFFDSLPAYQVELEDGAIRELVRAKPGGMSGVSTISGYLETLAGRQLAFSLLANGYTGDNKPVIALRKPVWRALVRYRPTTTE